jgi:2-polyprenyl-3-methyl-5-hydroxy-6-metoxy-1,4-benzoquinol methylase
VREFYLADPSNPYQQSGRSSGADRWAETRQCLVEAVHRSGDFLDIGCANGLLLESIIGWAAERGFALRPHGLDFVPELIELARLRLASHKPSFITENAFHWNPSRQYDFVRTNVEYVPRSDWIEFVHRQYAAVAPGGRLILCHYRNTQDPLIDPGAVANATGLPIAGRVEAPGVAAIWVPRGD